MKNKQQTRNKAFEVGDKIVDFGQVHRIFKIKKKKGPKGKEKKVICYRHDYKTPFNQGLSYSIPMANIAKTNLRRPISKKELRRLLKKLAKKPRAKVTFSPIKATAALNLNNPDKTIRVLKSLWLEKNDETVNFNKTKQDIFELAMKRLVEEMAFVASTSLTKARKKIKKALSKMENNELNGT